MRRQPSASTLRARRAIGSSRRKKFAIYLVTHNPAVTPSFQADHWDEIAVFLSEWHKQELLQQTGLVPIVMAKGGGP